MKSSWRSLFLVFLNWFILIKSPQSLVSCYLHSPSINFKKNYALHPLISKQSLSQAHQKNNKFAILNHHNPNTDTSHTSTFNSNVQIPMNIIYENKSYKIQAMKGESILSALERARASSDPNIRIPLPPIPHECRRGNCLTCSGKILCSTKSKKDYNDSDVLSPSSSSNVSQSENNLIRGEDGLNPYMSKEIEMAGFVLLCSSYVVGEGLTIEIGCKEEAWEFAYYGKMMEDEAKLVRTAAAAKSVRLAAEKNIPKWTKQTEQTLKKTLPLP